MVVLKFGGKSLGSRDKVFNVCKYIQKRAEQEKVVVVVSAFGSATNKLLDLVKEYSQGIINKREQDAVVATGEIISAGLVSLMLGSVGVSAISLSASHAQIQTKGDYSASVITSINKSAILDYLSCYDVVVVAGFQGVNDKGDITTLGRGGSDTTAVALGTALNCEVEIYSDYLGIFCGDPKNLKYKKLDTISYNNALEFSKNGAKVISPISADIAKQAKVKLACKDSSNPNSAGTFFSSVPTPFVGISVYDNLCEIVISCSNSADILKIAKFATKTINYHKLCVENCKISLIVAQKDREMVEKLIANQNNLLER